MSSGTNRLRIRGEYEDRISPKLKSMRGEFDKMGKSSAAKTVLQGVGMGAGISAFNLLGDAINFAVGQIGESITAASDLSETVSKSEVIFGDNAKAVSRWGDTMAEAAGLSKRAALDAASGFAGLFKTVGLELDQATDMSTKLTQLGSDLASFFNTDVADALAALKSGLNGESEPLRRFNVFLSESAVAAEAVRIGISDTGKSLTEAQKATARYSLILGQTGDAQGDYARTADGLANSQRTLAAEVENLQAAIGQDLLPVARDFTKWAKDDGVPMLAALVQGFKDLGDAMAVPGQWWDTLVGGLRDWTTEDIRAERAQKNLNRSIRQNTRDTEMMVDYQRAYQRSQQKATTSTRVLTRQYRRLGNAVKFSADQMDNLRSQSEDALDAMLESLFGPKELRRQLKDLAYDQKVNAREQQKLQDKIDKLKEAGKPIGKAKDALRDLRQESDDNKQEIAKVNLKLAEMGEITFDQLVTRLDKVGIKLGEDAALAKDLYGWLAAMGQARQRPRQHQADTSFGRAEGGPVLPFNTYTVGEHGRETLVMGASGGYVVPNAGSSAAPSNAVPVEIPIRIDGREIARVVDRNLYYVAARSPR